MTVWRANEPAGRCRGPSASACGGYPPCLAQRTPGRFRLVYRRIRWAARVMSPSAFRAGNGRRPRKIAAAWAWHAVCTTATCTRRRFSLTASLCDAGSICSRTAVRVVPTQGDQTDVRYR